MPYDETGPAVQYEQYEEECQRRDDAISHSAPEPMSAKTSAENELVYATRAVVEWESRGLMAPQHVQERLAKAHIAATAAGIVDYGICSVCRRIQIGKYHEHPCE